MQEILSEIHENIYTPLIDYDEPIPDTVSDSGETEPPAIELSEDENTETEETPYEPEHGEYEVSFFEPLSDSAFPSAIQGIGILTIEKINLRLPVAEGVEYATLRIAPGRVPQTAQIGEIGNAVIAGHRNYAFDSMFNRLGELEIGDVIEFQARSGEEMLFEVFEIAVIEPSDQIAFIQPVNDSIITLYTCTPIRTATHRLLIRAQRIF
jgi:sortase A